MTTQSSLSEYNPVHTAAWILAGLLLVGALGWMDWLIKWLIVIPALGFFIMGAAIGVVGLVLRFTVK